MEERIVFYQNEIEDAHLDATFHATWGWKGEAIRWQEWAAHCYRQIQLLRGF